MKMKPRGRMGILVFDGENYVMEPLPVPKLNQVLGLVGPVLIGSSTVLEILSGKLLPNLGREDNPPTKQQVLNYFEKSDYPLYKYLTWMLQDEVKICFKPEALYWVARDYRRRGILRDILENKDERGVKAEICSDLGLNQISGRKISSLSTGELQRFAIGLTAVQNAQVYMFAEPLTHLDVNRSLRLLKLFDL